MNRLILATKNQHKKSEIIKILSDYTIDITTLDEEDNFPDVIEDGHTFEENAIKKAIAISMFFKNFALADDSGLSIDALGGDPGIYSARFAGQQKSDDDNIKKLLQLMKDIPPANRQAHFTCVVAVANKGSVLKTFTGKCFGTIALCKKGKKGFGYDPIFIPNGYSKTFGEMESRIKNKLSHRYLALEKLALDAHKIFS